MSEVVKKQQLEEEQHNDKPIMDSEGTAAVNGDTTASAHNGDHHPDPDVVSLEGACAIMNVLETSVDAILASPEGPAGRRASSTGTPPPPQPLPMAEEGMSNSSASKQQSESSNQPVSPAKETITQSTKSAGAQTPSKLTVSCGVGCEGETVVSGTAMDATPQQQVMGSAGETETSSSKTTTTVAPSPSAGAASPQKLQQLHAENAALLAEVSSLQHRLFLAEEKLAKQAELANSAEEEKIDSDQAKLASLSPFRGRSASPQGCGDLFAPPIDSRVAPADVETYRVLLKTVWGRAANKLTSTPEEAHGKSEGESATPEGSNAKLEEAKPQAPCTIFSVDTTAALAVRLKKLETAPTAGFSSSSGKGAKFSKFFVVAVPAPPPVQRKATPSPSSSKRSGSPSSTGLMVRRPGVSPSRNMSTGSGASSGMRSVSSSAVTSARVGSTPGAAAARRPTASPARPATAAASKTPAYSSVKSNGSTVAARRTSPTGRSASPATTGFRQASPAATRTGGTSSAAKPTSTAPRPATASPATSTYGTRRPSVSPKPTTTRSTPSPTPKSTVSSTLPSTRSGSAKPDPAGRSVSPSKRVGVTNTTSTTPVRRPTIGGISKTAGTSPAAGTRTSSVSAPSPKRATVRAILSPLKDSVPDLEPTPRTPHGSHAVVAAKQPTPKPTTATSPAARRSSTGASTTTPAAKKTTFSSRAQVKQ